MLGEGDEWAHAGRYDLYLDATFRADRFIERIWNTVQSLPEYKDRTTLLVTTDHGRGATTKDWKDHGRKVPAAEATWMAAIGPAVPALGLRESMTVTTSQLAATIAAAVGEDFRDGLTRGGSGGCLGRSAVGGGAFEAPQSPDVTSLDPGLTAEGGGSRSAGRTTGRRTCQC